jgi:hypothetical protein
VPGAKKWIDEALKKYGIGVGLRIINYLVERARSRWNCDTVNALPPYPYVRFLICFSYYD